MTTGPGERAGSFVRSGPPRLKPQIVCLGKFGSDVILALGFAPMCVA
jgi:hypothetical protein